MQLLKDTILYDENCSYIKQRLQSTHYQVVHECTKEYCHKLLKQGWRRFGTMFFRPNCSHCEACQSIKIDVKNYRFSKSERRIFKKNSDLKLVMTRPVLDRNHLQIHEKYHKYMQQEKNWDYIPTTVKHYYLSFIQGYEDFGYEIQYILDEDLIGVDIVDLFSNAISATYFFYDPIHKKRSLGKLSLLHQIKIAKEQNLQWIYLGYYVKECDSLLYKREYEPLLTLQGRPNIDELDIWTTFSNLS